MRTRLLARFAGALALIPCSSPAGLPAAPLEVGTQERLAWPAAGELRLSLQQGDVLLLSRWDAGASSGSRPAAAGFASSLLVVGPVAGRGILRLAADPLGFAAGSPVFRERTALVLDSSLRSSRTGLLVAPLPGCGGLFAREHGGGTDCGAWVRVPLGSGAAAEGLLMSSRLQMSAGGDEWLLPNNAFPGGDMTNVAGRLCVESPRFDCSFTAFGSSARWAAPGSAVDLWIRGKSPWLDAAVLLAAAQPSYRSPDGAGLSDSWITSGSLGIGRDPRRGTAAVGITFGQDRLPFAPGPRVPCHALFQLDLERDFLVSPGAVLALRLDADKEVSWGTDGHRGDESRCGAGLQWEPGAVVLQAGAGLSERDGVEVRAAVALAPGSRVRGRVELRADALTTSSPTASVDLSVTHTAGAVTSTLTVGVADWPAAARRPVPGDHLRVSLTTAVRGSYPAGGVSPSRRPG